MTKATAVFIFFLSAFGLVLGGLSSLRLATQVFAKEPVYRLDARYHNLPPTLVAELLAHPPRRPFFGPGVHCDAGTFAGEQIEYCVCFGLEACAEAPNFHPDPHAYEVWTCTSPLGVIDDRNTGVCRARREPVVVVG